MQLSMPAAVARSRLVHGERELRSGDALAPRMRPLAFLDGLLNAGRVDAPQQRM